MLFSTYDTKLKDEGCVVFLDEQVILSSGSSKNKGSWVEKILIIKEWNGGGGAIGNEEMKSCFIHSGVGNHQQVLSREGAIVLEAAWEVNAK